MREGVNYHRSPKPTTVAFISMKQKDIGIWQNSIGIMLIIPYIIGNTSMDSVKLSDRGENTG